MRLYYIYEHEKVILLIHAKQGIIPTITFLSVNVSKNSCSYWIFSPFSWKCSVTFSFEIIAFLPNCYDFFSWQKKTKQYKIYCEILVKFNKPKTKVNKRLLLLCMLKLNSNFKNGIVLFIKRMNNFPLL